MRNLRDKSKPGGFFDTVSLGWVILGLRGDSTLDPRPSTLGTPEHRPRFDTRHSTFDGEGLVPANTAVSGFGSIGLSERRMSGVECRIAPKPATRMSPQFRPKLPGSKVQGRNEGTDVSYNRPSLESHARQHSRHRVRAEIH